MKKMYTAFIALFLAMIIIPAVYVFSADDITFSDNENRMLQTAPDFTWDNIMDGSFQEDITAYISDQFPARDKWTALGTKIKKLAGFKDIGGAYLGHDGYYMEKITENDVDMAKFMSNLKLVQSFASDSACDTTLLLIPATGTVMSDKLPQNARMYDAKALYNVAVSELKTVNVPDLYSVLEAQNDDYIYYRTDHHWTAKGAQLAYNCLMDGKGKFDSALELFSDNFRGTTYSKTLDSAASYDSVYTVPIKDGIKVTADGKDIPFYFKDAANEKDKYKVFFGGNYGEVKIEGGTDNGKTLLMIKDSFANSLVPFLTYDYETIIMLDLRYYMGSAIELVKNENVDEVIFVNEMSTFSNDNNLVKLGF